MEPSGDVCAKLKISCVSFSFAFHPSKHFSLPFPLQKVCCYTFQTKDHSFITVTNPRDSMDTYAEVLFQSNEKKKRNISHSHSHIKFT